MKFAFLVHPLSEESKALLQLNSDGSLLNTWGGDLLEFCKFLHESMEARRQALHSPQVPTVRMIDQLNNLRSATGAVADGRLVEIPMGAAEILDSPSQAIEYMEQAVGMAAEWGANIIGLGSMTGIVGGGGSYISEHSPVPVTTGNCLTVHAALANLHHATREANIDLARETVAIVGIPGSIATAAAKLLADQVGRLLLVSRRDSAKARKVAQELSAELLLDIPSALQQSRLIFTATSTGSCIDQQWLQPGSVVVDVGVPTDVQGSTAERCDVLIVSGGLTLVPDSFPRDSMYIGFHYGMIPSCLGETICLALENRSECFSLGRSLDVERICEIGRIALRHGFRFDRLYSFGVPLGAEQISEFLKASTTASSSSFFEREQVEHVTDHKSNGHSRMDDLFSPDSSIDEPEPLPAPDDLAVRARQQYERFINPVLTAVSGEDGFARTFIRGEGCYLWDDQETRYVDLVSGFGSVNIGHNHPRVIEELTRAMTHQAPGFAQTAVNPIAARLAEELVAVSPAGLEMVFFSNSGTESVEAALKLARLATGRSGLLHCDRSFHGKSLGSLSVTGNPDYQKPFGPLLPECTSIPFGDLEALERELRSRQYAAFIVEPIQAEAGIYVPPSDYLPQAKAVCQKYGTLLVVDEVQTGMGRTGNLFAVDALGVEPDIMTLAKSLSGGLVPIGATLARRDLWLKAYGTIDRFALHTSTFGGGSLACTAGLATLRVLQEENLVQKCAARGRRLLEGLQTLVERHQHKPLVAVRGKGLLIGLEFAPMLPAIAAHYRGATSTGVMQYLTRSLDRVTESMCAVYAMQTLLNAYGFYAQVARSNHFVLRIQPPLTIEDEHIDELLVAIDRIASDLHDSAEILDSIISKSTLGIHEKENPAQTRAGL